ncbi:MAG: GlsB/YeaQ/YmgE family stress response membrane protein [Bradyrhizobium sp.]
MMLGTNSIVVILIIGLIAGWLAGMIMGGGFGLIGDIIIGIIGAYIGNWLWGELHLPVIGGFWISAIVISTVGACILLFILRLVRRV